MAAIWTSGTLSARRRIIRPRLARPARIVVERCHAISVWRSSAVRWIVSAGFRPRGIAILKVTNPHRGQGACNTSPVVSSGEEHAYSRGIEYEKGGHRSTRLERAWQYAKGRC